MSYKTGWLLLALVLLGLSACGGGSDCGGYLNCVSAITVTPANPTVAKGQSLAFVATATFQDGSTADFGDLPHPTWTSSNPAVGTVSPAGVVTTTESGTTTITFTQAASPLNVGGGPIVGSTILTVVAPTVVSIAVTPASTALKLGQNQSFTATGTLTDGSHQDVTQTASWSSSDVTVVRLNNSAGRVGIANSRGPGSASVKATLGSVSGQATATVTRGTPKFLYASNLGAGTITAFRVDPVSGALSAFGAPYTTSSGSTSIAVTRDFKFLYSADFGLGNVSGFVIQSDGTLIPAAGTPLPAGVGPLGLVTHPEADVLYVAQQGSGIGIFAINPVSGALTPAGAVSEPNGPQFAALSPDGKYYYQPLASMDQIEPFAADAATGALTQLPAGPAATEAFPRAIAIDPAGKFLYIAISDSGSGTSTSLEGFLIDPVTGALTKIPASPFQVPATPVWVTVDPSGRFLYVSSNHSSVISAFSIDPDSGTLTAVPGSPFAAAGDPGFMLVDPSGQFLYAGTFSSTGVLGYRIDQTTGALSPNAAGSAPGDIVWSLAVTQ